MQLIRVYLSRNQLAEPTGPIPATATTAPLKLTTVRPRQLPRTMGCPVRAAYFWPPSSPVAGGGRKDRAQPSPPAWQRWAANVLHELAAGFWAAADWGDLLLDPLAALREGLHTTFANLKFLPTSALCPQIMRPSPRCPRIVRATNCPAARVNDNAEVGTGPNSPKLSAATVQLCANRWCMQV